LQQEKYELDFPSTKQDKAKKKFLQMCLLLSL
jgi:hypothetical protein